LRKGDFWSGLTLAALGTYIVIEAWRWDYMGMDGPGPGFFPLWYGGAMVVLSLLLVAGAVLKSSPAADGANWSEFGRALICWTAFAACIALLNVLGFVVSFAVMTWFIVAVMFRQSQLKAITIAIGGALGFYALFSVALGVSLPSGYLF
jgi:putative tricarboxylic transport membrane protein